MDLLRRIKWASYLWALAIGIALVLSIFPQDMLFSGVVPDSRLWGDVAAHVIAQRAYFQDSWHWPLLLTTLLDAPAGLNVAMADANPFVALPLKLLRQFLPPGFSAVELWLAFTYLLQPVAAVFALRSAGETRFVPALSAALIAASMPTFLFRHIHSALSSHFLILFALGSYFRTIGRLRWHAALPTILLPISFLIHPYLAFMVGAVLLAAPVSMTLNGDRRALTAVLPLITGLVVTTAIAWILNYQVTTPPGGFGQYSMDILAPIDPAHSLFLGTGIPFVTRVDPRGEGFQYLGFGLIVLLLISVTSLLVKRQVKLFRNHLGIVLCCICLTALALSNSIHFGTHQILVCGSAPRVLDELRMSGRLFWPVAYFSIIGAIALIPRLFPLRIGYVVLIGTAFLQVMDLQPLRADVHDYLRHNTPEFVNPNNLTLLLNAHNQMTMLPTYGCGANVLVPEFSQLLLAASRRGVAVNTMYVARFAQLQNCADAEVAQRQLVAGELRVFLPIEAQAGPASVPGGDRYCRMLNTIAVCTLRTDLLNGLPAVASPILEYGKTILTSGRGQVLILGAGWYAPEPPGTWSVDHQAALLCFRIRPPVAGLTFTANAIGFAGTGQVQHIILLANNHPVAAWDLPGQPTLLRAQIPRSDLVAGTQVFDFQIAAPSRPSSDGESVDTRQLGIFLMSVPLDSPHL